MEAALIGVLDPRSSSPGVRCCVAARPWWPGVSSLSLSMCSGLSKAGPPVGERSGKESPAIVAAFTREVDGG
eukprot:11309977-Heterocapsa_arctica.AAC.1